MTQFYEGMPADVAFKEQSLDNLLGEVVAKEWRKQLRISETEKYAHVTFFFNGQDEKPNDNEDRVLIPSPKVETYDLKPEMSVYEITEELTKKIESELYDLIITNLVNGDMVGHTGNPEAIKKSIGSSRCMCGKNSREMIGTQLYNNHNCRSWKCRRSNGRMENKSYHE